MTKLSLTVSTSTLECLSFGDDETAQILAAHVGANLMDLLADNHEKTLLQDHLERLITPQDAFVTFNLVFKAPHVPDTADRSPVHGVFRSPIRAIHTCGVSHLACFVQMNLTNDRDAFHITALEYSRKHRESLIQQEFGSWLLEEQVEKAVIATDALGTVVFWNRFASDLYQWSRQEALGRNVLELTSSEMTQEQGIEIMGKLSQGQHWKGFFGVKRKDSSKFVAHVTDTPICDTDGTLKFIVGVSADYTQMHDLMDELKTLNADLEKEVKVRTEKLLQVQLEAEKAAAASQSKTEMMQMLSHEFRTPLQGIMGVASTMLIDLEEGTIYDCLSTILASSRLLLTLINNVLDLGKMDADMMQAIEICSIPVLPCIRGTIQFCYHFAALNEVSIVLENDDVEWTVQANRLRLEQIMVNLISNGIKYTDPGTQVVVSIRQCSTTQMVTEALNAGTSDLKFMSPSNLKDIQKQRQREVVTVVSVRDHGKGIPEHEMSSLFGAYVQLQNSKEKDQNYDGSSGTFVGQPSGSGLGLNLVMKFVSRMNGHVWVQNCDSGGGAIFSFCLARGEESFCDKDSSHADSKQQQQVLELSEEDAGSFRVMVVDDSMINLKVLERMLVRLGVKKIKTCRDGLKALEYLRGVENLQDLPNVILSDLNMPNVDGYELMGLVREIYLYVSPPSAMACSADWTRETEERCIRAGFDGVLRKPITFSYLKDYLAQIAADDLNEN